MRDQRGFTVVELLVAISAGIIVLFGIMTVVNASIKNSALITQRVEANQRARPVLQRIMDQLHSSCMAPGIAPVRSGSTESSIDFVHATGSSVSPNPERRVITYNPATLTLSESVYPYASGSAPSWLFGATPTNRQLLTDVGYADLGSPPVATPVFQYYGYTNGAISAAPMTPPLDATEASRTVLVKVSFSVSPRSNGARDANAALSVSDSALLRFTPAGEDTTQENVPCA